MHLPPDFPLTGTEKALVLQDLVARSLASDEPEKNGTEVSHAMVGCPQGIQFNQI